MQESKRKKKKNETSHKQKCMLTRFRDKSSLWICHFSALFWILWVFDELCGCVLGLLQSCLEMCSLFFPPLLISHLGSVDFHRLIHVGPLFTSRSGGFQFFCHIFFLRSRTSFAEMPASFLFAVESPACVCFLLSIFPFLHLQLQAFRSASGNCCKPATVTFQQTCLFGTCSHFCRQLSY